MPSVLSLTDSGFFQPSGGDQLQVCRYQLEARPIFRRERQLRRSARLTVITRFRAVRTRKWSGLFLLSWIRLSDDLLMEWLPAPLGAIRA